ncbi:MAG: alpha/beta hydrolase [Candidatus Latescibacterota bacterium]
MLIRYAIALFLGALPQLATAATLSLTPCPAGQIKASGAECGTLEVYEDRQAQQGRTIALNVAVLPAFSRNPAPDPLFAFAGGPGMGSTELAGMAESALRRVREERDIVLIDQRGTGASGPLDCAIDDVDSTLYQEDPIGWVIERLNACREGYEADLRRYTTPIAMDDVDDVRRALGYERINVWGGSYGTRAALVYMRRHPERVRSAILDGLAPPEIRLPLHMGTDAQRALDKLWSDCAADAACATTYGNISAKFDSLLVRFAEPVEIAFQHPRTGQTIRAPLRSYGIASLVRTALYSAEFSSLIPLVIDRAYAGDYAPLAALGDPWEDISSKMSQGMFYSVVCSEDVPFIDDSEKAQLSSSFFGPEAIDMMQTVCASWPRGDLPADYHEPVSTDHPTLVLSGNLDPVTPPRWGESVAEHLPNARHIVVPGVGHGATPNGCVPKLIAQFIDAASAAQLDAECVQSLDRPLFFTSYTGYGSSTDEETAP